MFAFAWQAGRFLELPLPPETVASTANAITASGRIGGLVQRVRDDKTSVTESYVLTLPAAE
jgi:hypothetical protein